MLVASGASAQESPSESPAPPWQGWKLRLALSGNLSFTHNRKVVGNPDGLTLQVGGELETEARGRRGPHEWQNRLTAAHGQTKTPLLDEFLKTTDSFELMTMYLFHLPAVDWLGPFARARLSTALLPAFHVQPTDVTVSRTFVDGTTSTEALPAQSQLDLTGAFEPVLLRQSAGFFALVEEGGALVIDFRAGPAVQEIIVRDGFVLADDGATPELEIRQLRDSLEAGPELAGEAKGILVEQVTWSVEANFFYPFVTSIETDLEGLDRLNANVNGRLSVKLTGWASLDYTFVATRVPLVLDAWQIQNGLLFTVGFERVHPPPPPPPCPEGCVQPE
jgi:hypothetical protein